MKRPLIAAAAILLCMPLVIAEQPVKNVLFIGIDDLRVELGCYGASHMKTPNIDQLAKSGLQFDRAYCQQAICAASRISLLTGMRPDTTGVYDLDHPLNSTIPDAMSMPRFFKENGYKTVSLGKIYHHTKDDQAYWDVLDRCSQPTYANPKTAKRIAEKTKAARAKKLKAKALRLATKGPAYESGDVPDNQYSDGAIADAAIEQLRQSDGKPFFLAVGFKKPHLPFVAPTKYWNMYDPAKIAIPSREKPVDVADQALTSWGELRAYDRMPDQGDANDEQTRSLIHGYRACVSYVDAQIGRVLAELDKQGLRDTTLIVLWGDHGWKLGDYGCWCKHTNFELDTHVPLIFSGPSVPIQTRSDALVEYIDIYPTLAQWCGLHVPGHCEGSSLTALFTNPLQKWKPAALSQYPRAGGMGYSLRSGDFRYTEWRRKDGKIIATELYDHSKSDIATVNLAANPEHAQTVKTLHKLLEQTK
ncbi:Arylsulfatase [Planctomycetes bacterium CA13]|uniref:Arylsulfatase n=1 Tax=Novipirellula herctigrandis TaxID=2527986 RepID=A0A5C5ZC98_9BACT|nr:Arylsulfatase [Planctomycetes bacterium CA13]